MIFIWIILGVVVYLLCGFGCDILCCWYEKKYENVEAQHEEKSDITLWFLWPFILISVIWMIFATHMCRTMNRIIQKMYAKMDERSNRHATKNCKEVEK